jgi:monothiol glutaredoxin
MNKAKIEKLLTSNPVILFMKGDKYMPKCGFSMNAVEILKDLNIAFVTYDILEDEELRQDLKEYSHWPTYPQLYIESELIGGCDIMKNLYLSGELEKKLSNYTNETDN